MDRGSGYGPSMPPLVAPGDFSEKLIFGLFWLRGVTTLVKKKKEGVRILDVLSMEVMQKP